MVNEYNGLKPGLYIRRPGGNIKSLSLLESGQWEDLWGRDSKNPPIEVLAASVSWVFVALYERREQIREIPSFWTRDGENELEPPKQLGFHPWVELARIDEALQLYGQAFMFKQRLRGRGLNLIWLDPATMELDNDAIDDETRSYRWYWRNVNGARIRVPAEDVVRIWVPRMRELAPGTTAGQATSLAAQIIHNLDRTLDAFFETNGLPPLLINVPAGISEQEATRVKTSLARLFNRRTRHSEGHKTVALSGDVSVEKLSFAPNEMDTVVIGEAQREAILSGHGVPPALVYKDVNMAEAQEKRVHFARRIAGRVGFIIEQVNEDPDVARSGIMLHAAPERLEVMQRAELEKAEAIQRLTGVPVLTVNEARERLELPPVPGGDEISISFGMRQPLGGQLQDVGEDATPEPPPVRALEIDRLRRFVANGKHHKRDFTSDILTPGEIKAITLETVVATLMAHEDNDLDWQGYP